MDSSMQNNAMAMSWHSGCPRARRRARAIPRRADDNCCHKKEKTRQPAFAGDLRKRIVSLTISYVPQFSRRMREFIRHELSRPDAEQRVGEGVSNAVAQQHFA